MALSRLELSTGKKGPWNQPFTGQQRMPLPSRLKEREMFSLSAVELNLTLIGDKDAKPVGS